MSPPEFRAPHCTRYRYRYSECRRCADACPHNAIGLSDEGVTIGTQTAGTAPFVPLHVQPKRLRPRMPRLLSCCGGRSSLAR